MRLAPGITMPFYISIFFSMISLIYSLFSLLVVTLRVHWLVDTVSLLITYYRSPAFLYAFLSL